MDNNSKSFCVTNLHNNAKPLYVTTPSITRKRLGHLIHHRKGKARTQILRRHLFSPTASVTVGDLAACDALMQKQRINAGQCDVG